MTASLSFGPEWDAVEIICLRGSGDSISQQEIIDRFTTPNFLWGEFLEQTLRHKLGPTVAHILLVECGYDQLPPRIEEAFQNILGANVYKRNIWYRYASTIIDEMARSGIPVSMRKESGLEFTAYEGVGMRRLGDLDLFVLPGASHEAATTMEALGFSEGIYNWRTGQVDAYERRALIAHKLSPDHLPAYSYATGDPIVPVIEVDIATSFTWSRSPYQFSADNAMQSRVWHEIVGQEGMTLPYFSPIYQFLDTVLHCYKEAWVPKLLDTQKDVDLAKFMDIMALWRLYGPTYIRMDLLGLLEQLEITFPMAWVLKHLDNLFSLSISSQLGLTAVVTDIELKMAGGENNRSRSWSGDMRSRLHHKRRHELFYDDVS